MSFDPDAFLAGTSPKTTNNDTAKFDPDAFLADGEEPKDGPLDRGIKNTGFNSKMTAQLALNDTQGLADTVKEAHEYNQANPGMPEGKKLYDAYEKGDGFWGGVGNTVKQIGDDYTEAKGFIPGVKKVGRDFRAMGEGVITQLPNAVAPMVGTFGGAALGAAAGSEVPVVGNVAGAVVGSLVGGSAGNALVEGGGQVQDGLQKAGIDAFDTQAVKAYLDENRGQLLKQTGIKSGVLGVVDTVTGGAAHALLTGPLKSATTRALTALGIDEADHAAVAAAKKSGAIDALVKNDEKYLASQKGAENIARNAGAAALEPVGEFTGEYFGQGLASDDWDTKNAGLEALSSIGQSAGTFGVQKAIQYGMSQGGAQNATEPSDNPTNPNPANPGSGDGAGVDPLARPDEARSRKQQIQEEIDLIQSKGLDATQEDLDREKRLNQQLMFEEANERIAQEKIKVNGQQNLTNNSDGAGQDAINLSEIAGQLPPQKPSERMGLDPNAGALSDAAALSVDSGASGNFFLPGEDVIPWDDPVATNGTEQVNPASQWDAMDATQRASVLTSVDGMSDRNGNPNVIANRLSQLNWHNMPLGAQEKVNSAITANVAAPVNNLMQQQEELQPASSIYADQENQNRDRGRADSLVQMAGIKNDPDYDRLGRSQSPSTGAPMVFAPKETLGGLSVIGHPETVTGSDGRKIQTQYAVVEASELQASHDVSGNQNPVYSSELPAGNLKALNNGRTAGIQAAYTSGNADNYKAALIGDAARLGVDPNAIAAMKQPVLVRTYDEANNNGDMGAWSNASEGLRLSAAEQANNDARVLGDLHDVVLDDDGKLSPTKNMNLIHRFVNSLPSNEASALRKRDGSVNLPAVEKRIQHAMLAIGFNNDDLINAATEDTEQSRNLMSALTQSAAGFAKLPAQAAIGTKRLVVRAAEMYQKARESGTSVEQLGRQQDLMGGYSAHEEAIADYMEKNIRAPKKVAMVLGWLADYENQAHQSQGSMFGDDLEATKDAAIAYANQRIKQEFGNDANLFREQPATDHGRGTGATTGAHEGATERAGRSGGAAFGLTSQTEQQLAEQEAAQAAAKEEAAQREKAAQDKANADAEVGQFTLTGSDRAADVAAAQGQQDIFSGGRREPETPDHATRWQSMSIEDRKEALKQEGGWPTQANGLSVIGQQLAQQDWSKLPSGMRDKIQGLMDKAQSARNANIDSAAHAAATSPQNTLQEPTQAQKEAGNYQKGHISLQGLNITIENPRGSERSGKREDGSTWSHAMSDHYGYIKRTIGADKENVDVYVGPQPDAGQVYVVDQIDQKTGKFDEHKAMIGFSDQPAAESAYRSNFDAGWKTGAVHAMSMDEFKTWLKDGDTTKPLSQQKTQSAPKQNPETKAVLAEKPEAVQQKANDILREGFSDEQYRMDSMQTRQKIADKLKNAQVSDEKGIKSLTQLWMARVVVGAKQLNMLPSEYYSRFMEGEIKRGEAPDDDSSHLYSEKDDAFGGLSSEQVALLESLGLLSKPQQEVFRELGENQWGERYVRPAGYVSSTQRGNEEVDLRGEKHQFLSDFEASVTGRGSALARAGVLAEIRKLSERISSDLGGEAEKPRVGVDSPLGPFEGYRVNADIVKDGASKTLHVEVYGKEQIEAGLTDEPALLFTVSENGEFIVNGPSPNGETFREFQKRGWAEHAHDKAGNIEPDYTRLTPTAGHKTMPMDQLKPLLADVHARVRAWRKEDQVGLYWVRSTGATGGVLGRETAVFFQKGKGTKQGAVNPTTKDITLSEKDSDASTFLHETGHIFLETQIDMAGMANAGAVVQHDADTVLKWFGIAGDTLPSRLATWNAMTLEEKRPFHEQYAESFEQYLLEGKAPSNDLKSAFDNFRRWLKQVYKSIKAFLASHEGAKLNDDVRAVFDRLLATEEQIQEMEKARNAKALAGEKPLLANTAETKAFEAAAKTVVDNVSAGKTEIGKAKEVPSILDVSQSKYIASQAKEQGIKKGSPGYDFAIKKLEAIYDEDLNKALAALPFDQFHEWNVKDGSKSETMNRKAWEALREEYGIHNESAYKPKNIFHEIDRKDEPTNDDLLGSPKNVRLDDETDQDFIVRNQQSILADLLDEAKQELNRRTKASIPVAPKIDKIKDNIIRKYGLDDAGFGDADVVIGKALMPLLDIGKTPQERIKNIEQALNAALKNDAASPKDVSSKTEPTAAPKQDDRDYGVGAEIAISDEIAARYRNSKQSEPIEGTGWILHDDNITSNGSVQLVSANRSVIRNFNYDEKSGTDHRRAAVRAIAWAQENKDKFDAPKGELESAPVFNNQKKEKVKPEAVSEPSKVEQETKPTPATNKLEDFGEKLEGKRSRAPRFISEELSDSDIANKPLSEIWPADAHEKEENKATAALMYAMRGEIPAKPRKSYRLGRWVERVKSAKEAIKDGIFNNMGVSELAKMFRSKGVSNFNSFADRLEALYAIERDQWKRLGDVAVYPNATRYEGDKAVPSSFGQFEVDGKRHRVDGAKTVEDLLPAIHSALGAEAAEKRIAFEIRHDMDGYFIGKEGDRERRALKRFPAVAEARAFLKNNYDDVLSAWNAVKDSDNVKKEDTRRAENRPRTGKDYRKGKDATPGMFSDAFGFRGVEFGKWVTQGKNAKERQGMLNLAYDALHDLADIVGIPPKAISLNGTMGLAFGSRGSGNASAHFERGNLVINLTKTKGAGNLAHEWFHALDNYFSRMRRGGEASSVADAAGNRKDSYITYQPEAYYEKDGQFIPAKDFEKAAAAGREGFKDSADYAARGEHNSIWRQIGSTTEGWVKRDAVRAEVEQAFADLVEVLNASPMLERALKLDKNPKNDYWSRIIERGARAFENYVISKMRTQGYDNDYLANVTPIEDFVRSEDRYPYLLPSEEQPIADAFDALFGTIQTKESDDGKVVLFSRAQSTKANYENRIDELFAGAKPSREGVRVLDEADVLSVLGYGEKPLVLKESKVSSAPDNHPKMTVDYWKKVPEWLENPVAVFESDTKPGDLVFIPNEMVGGNVVFVTVSPDSSVMNLDVHVLTNGYDRNNYEKTPFDRWMKEGKLLYVDLKNSPAFNDTSGLQLPRVYRQARGFNANIKTERDLGNYRQTNGIQESLASHVSTGFSVAEIKESLSKTFGHAADKLQRLGLVTVVQTEKEAMDLAYKARAEKAGKDVSDFDVKYSETGDVQGFYDKQTGKSFLVADNLTDETASSVLVHEVGIHMAADTTNPRGKRAMDGMIQRAGNLLKLEKSAFMDSVRQRMKEAGETSNEEAAAYIAEEYEANRANAPSAVVQWVKDFIAAVRGWLFQRGVIVKDNMLTAADIAAIARSNVKQAAKGNGQGGSVGTQFSRTQSTQAKYEKRIDELFSGAKPNLQGVRILDKSDILGLLGMSDAPVHLVESKVKQGMANHPLMTPKQWKSIPQWLDNPAAVFDSDTKHGRLVVIAPELVGGNTVRMIIEPRASGDGVNLMINAYDAAHSPFDRWTRDGLLRFADGQKLALIAKSFQSRLTGLLNTSGRGAILTEKNLAGYRKADGVTAADLHYSRAAVKQYANRAASELNKTFSSPNTLNWWHKTVGTMYNLAERSPAFKRVFDAAQGFIDDVSHYANDAADFAPTILPKLEKWSDIAKTSIASADNKAIEKPIHEGTLAWTRREDGSPVKVEDLIKESKTLSTDDKIARLLRSQKLQRGVLKMWQGMSPENLQKRVDSFYDKHWLKAGVVWNDSELKQMFGLNDKQVGLYKEYRAAIDRSLDTLARADMLRFVGEDAKDIKDAVMDADNIRDAAAMLTQHLMRKAKEDTDREKLLMELVHGIHERHDKVNELQKEGYAPLSRFGKYTVDVVDPDTGERQYFSMFETKREANAMAEAMRKEFGDKAVSQGTLSDEAYKLFSDMSPETLELFGNMLGLESTGDNTQDIAFQEYLKLTKTNRSAMRRLIHRQGIVGYSQDMPRILANFVYSNARQTAAGLNMGEMGEALNAIPKAQGELKDAAIRLADYVKNPREEAQAVRGLLFAQYLGGSVASAMVNMTQPFAVSFPYLTQFTSVKDSAAQLGRAAKELAQRNPKYDPELTAALHRAIEDGVVAPQEIHQLMAQARGSGTLSIGDGTKTGEAAAAAKNAVSKLAFGWGKVFSMAEQVNRQMTFVAAYRIAKAKGMDNAEAFARKAVVDTQFQYSKANKMQWGRGAVGGTLMTFKTYSIAYVELLHRMYTQGGPEGKRAALLALGVLMLMGGAGGLPFEEDLEDAAEALAQKLGYNISIKQKRQEFLSDVFGNGMANFIENGITGLPGIPIDVSGRLGMGNLIPGTGLLKTKTDHTRDVLEIAGPIGDLASRVGSGVGRVLSGDVLGGALEMSPVAIRNAVKGIDMASKGMYRDQKGYKVLDTNPVEAASKAIGFQPQGVARIQEANAVNQQQKAFYNLRATEIRSLWAQGIFEKDSGKVDRAREQIADWNEKNPEQRMVIAMPSVWRRVREMNKTKDERIAATAPKAMRQKMRESIADLQREQ